jgi:hypothetical protein
MLLFCYCSQFLQLLVFLIYLYSLLSLTDYCLFNLMRLSVVSCFRCWLVGGLRLNAINVFIVDSVILILLL